MTQWAGKLRFGDQCVLNLYLAGHMRFFYEVSGLSTRTITHRWLAMRWPTQSRQVQHNLMARSESAQS